MIRYAIAVLALGLWLSPVSAGEFNKKLSVGDKVPAFEVKGVDEKGYTLDTFKDKDLLVVIVYSNTSPEGVAA